MELLLMGTIRDDDNDCIFVFVFWVCFGVSFFLFSFFWFFVCFGFFAVVVCVVIVSLKFHSLYHLQCASKIRACKHVIYHFQ